MTRLWKVSLLAVLFAMPALANETGGDCLLNIFVYHLKEAGAVRYCEGDRILPEGMKRIERLFRSRESDLIHPVDPRLVRLIDEIEDHFNVRQVEIISGYRSQAFNKELKESGHTVANESLHTKGMAADIHLDEITEEDLRDYAHSLGRGGVGFYPSLNMVHVDVGPVRTWGETAPRKGWVGEKNEEIPVTLTVSPDRTFTKRLQRLTIEQHDPRHPVVIAPRITIQFFDRGEWRDLKTISVSEIDRPLDDLPFGKYRLKAAVQGRPALFQFSNEFYFKRPRRGSFSN